MDGFPLLGEASKDLLEEAAKAASSNHQHVDEPFRGDIARDEKTTVVPFRRADAALPLLAKLSSSVILVAPPVGMPIPDYMRRVVADVVARCAPEKNLLLVAAQADAVVSVVFTTLDLADLYRLSMGEPATLKKAGQLISDTLDEVAVQRIMLFVRALENKENIYDPAVVEIVTAVIEEIASATASGPIIWPEMIEAVTKYYASKPSVMVRELPDGLTATVHWLHGEIHRDEQPEPLSAARTTAAPRPARRQSRRTAPRRSRLRWSQN